MTIIPNSVPSSPDNRDIASVVWHVNKCQLAFFAGHLSIRATSVYVP